MRTLVRVGPLDRAGGGKPASAGTGKKYKYDSTGADCATQPPAATPAVTDASYKIGPQDVLRIDVWKENGDFAIGTGATRRENFAAVAERRAGGGADGDGAGEHHHGRVEEIHQQPASDRKR